MKKYLHILILGCLVFFSSAWAQEKTIEIKEYSFTPQTLTIEAGTKVTWVNRDETPHTIDENNKLFRSPALDTDEKFSYTFTTPGTYPFHCRLHSKMTGTITVTGGK